MFRDNNIIDGKKISEKILANLKDKIESNKISAKLAIILVGNDPLSAIYVNNKIKAAAKVGILTELKKLSSDISEKDLLNEIKQLNLNKEVSGIIIQMPLPKHISKFKVIKTVDPMKDVDGFHPVNLGMLYSPYDHNFVPCTALGCLELVKNCIDNLQGKNVAIIGRSNIVGRPLAALLLKEDCTVTICHSKTKDLKSITYKADIVIAAMGKAKFLTKEYFNSNAVIIDVGINKIVCKDKCELVGDVDFQSAKDNVKYITPVPGGVGPMTVAYLLVNTYNASLCLQTSSTSKLI